MMASLRNNKTKHFHKTVEYKTMSLGAILTIELYGLLEPGGYFRIADP